MSDSQPTPEQDAANGTVSAANTPDPEATYEPDPTDPNYTGEVGEGRTGLSMAQQGRGLRIAGQSGEYFPDATATAPDADEFEATSDEDAPNVGHVAHSESGTTSDTPIFDATTKGE